MYLSDRILVVAAVISGRDFPERPDYHLVCEAKLNNEVLTTDPTPHESQPKIEQELAWALDRTSLRQHRLQRSSLKIQVFAIDVHSPSKEAIGFFLLDLRSCSFVKNYKWYRLLHCKYKSSPTIFCGIYLDSDGSELPVMKGQTGFVASLGPTDLRPRIITPSPDTTDGSDFGRPSEGVWYAIGPEQLIREEFLLELRFTEVARLASLIPVEKELGTEGHTGFYISCDLIGKSVSTRRFDDLLCNELTSEGHQFFIRSTVDILRAYFAQTTPLHVKLYYGVRPLAEALIPIERLLSSSTQISSVPVTLNGTFELIPIQPHGSPTNLTQPHMDERPYVALTLSLSHHQWLDDSHHISTPFRGDGHASPTRHGHKARSRTRAIDPTHMLKATGQTQMIDGPSSFVSTNPVRATFEIEEPLRRFCFTIELRTLRNFHEFDHDRMVYARYVYPLFGSGAPIMTRSIAISRHKEVILPEGFCAFEFAASRTELNERLSETPLVIEIFDRNEGSSVGDELIGYASVELAAVLRSPTNESSPSRLRTCKYSGIEGVYSSLPKTDGTGLASGTERPVGEITYNLLLEDQGPYDLPEPESVETATAERKRIRPHSTPPISFGTSNYDDLRETPEYHAALEFELWRANEEAKFTAHLKQREQNIMTTLAEEWHKRDNQRETIYRRKLSEYQALEDKLRTTLAQLATRERQLAASEIELARIREETVRDVELKRKEAMQRAHNQVNEIECLLRLEKKKSEDWKSQAEEWQSKYKVLNDELMTLRQRMIKLEQQSAIAAHSEKPDGNKSSSNSEAVVNYQIELARLTTELATVRGVLTKTERSLEEAQRKQLRYRQLWMRTLQEVARLKQAAESAAQQTLAQREAELDLLRTRYLNIESKELNNRLLSMNTETPPHLSGADPTNSGKNQLQGVRDQMENFLVRPPHWSGNRTEAEGPKESELARLIDERDGLLQTGVYDSDDSIIANLERQIRELMDLRPNE
ncbi:unnamed protein product [Calicophoron daubneyi]|uniref:DUF3668 domain-containing protein n=1 Tax=Calicophoron daubneyi TaxID=300641 RepID=A0AAV2TWQ3_CALDB